jgi:hypothetical protein
MSQNKRAHRRHDLRLSAELSSARGRFTATTRNVSVGGCCIESAYRLVEGDRLEVALFLVVDGIEVDDFPALRVRGQVQWCADNDEAPLEVRHLAGLRFEDTTPEQAAWLEDVLARTGAG